MKVRDLVCQTGEWLRGTGSSSDVVVSTRVRLARNLAGFNFVGRCTVEEREVIESFLHSALEKLGRGFAYFKMISLSQLERMFLLERHLISREHCDASSGQAVAIDPSESVSIMINEEDHLRMQFLRAGFELDELAKESFELDDRFSEYVEYAYSDRLGFLTACPTNVGTGMRVSVMLHLPALETIKQIEKVFQLVRQLNLAVRGFYGEGTQATASFYQVSNQITLGKSEEETIANIKSIVPQIAEAERNARNALMNSGRALVEDKVWRALGLLKNARRIDTSEALTLLSEVRLGIHLGLINGFSISELNSVFLSVQPAHLQILEGREMEDPLERDVARASLIRRRLNEKEKTDSES